MSFIADIRCRTIHCPMRMTFVTALGRKSSSTNILIDVVLDSGQIGQGEVATSFVQPHETPEAITQIVQEARRELAGKPIGEYPHLLGQIRRRHEHFHMSLAGLEVALFRAELASRGEDEFRHWGGRLRRLETDITVSFLPEPGPAAREPSLPATSKPALAEWLDKVMPIGFTAYKVKVSGDVGADMQFVCRVRELLAARLEHFRLRLDGNQGYTAAGFREMLDRLAKERLEVECFEQPLRRDDLAGLRSLRGKRSIPVVLDETIFSAADCRRVIDEGLAEGVNIKIAKSGIAESVEILRLARSAGLKLMIGCMTETMIGLSAGINLAAGSGVFDFVDLDSVHLLAEGPGNGRIRTDGIRMDGPFYIMEE